MAGFRGRKLRSSTHIHYYVAVDELCRERLIAEGGIDPGRIEVILNFFDARLFPPRTPLPRKPKLALVFNNDFREGAELNILREACARYGVELHVRGLGNGNPTARPGDLFAAYDIVFAKARSAIEALAVGAAVVLCAPGRLGPMVTSGNFAALRQWNFGIRTLDRPLDVDLVAKEFGKYDSADAARVSQLTREACELQPPWTGFWSYINVSSLRLNTSQRTVRERAPVRPGISNVGPRFTKITSASWRTATSGTTAAVLPNGRLRSGSAGSSQLRLRRKARSPSRHVCVRMRNERLAAFRLNSRLCAPRRPGGGPRGYDRVRRSNCCLAA